MTDRSAGGRGRGGAEAALASRPTMAPGAIVMCVGTMGVIWTPAGHAHLLTSWAAAVARSFDGSVSVAEVAADVRSTTLLAPTVAEESVLAVCRDLGGWGALARGWEEPGPGARVASAPAGVVDDLERSGGLGLDDESGLAAFRGELVTDGRRAAILPPGLLDWWDARAMVRAAGLVAEPGSTVVLGPEGVRSSRTLASRGNRGWFEPAVLYTSQMGPPVDIGTIQAEAALTLVRNLTSRRTPHEATARQIATLVTSARIGVLLWTEWTEPVPEQVVAEIASILRCDGGR